MPCLVTPLTECADSCAWQIKTLFIFVFCSSIYAFFAKRNKPPPPPLPPSHYSRQFGWRVKGISLSNFSDEEARQLTDAGNKNVRPHFWAYYDVSKNPAIPAGNADLIKPFIERLLKQRYWHLDTPANKGKKICYFDAAAAAGVLCGV